MPKKQLTAIVVAVVTTTVEVDVVVVGPEVDKAGININMPMQVPECQGHL